MNKRQPNSSNAQPAQPEFTNAADAASRWWLQLQQATTLTQQAEFQQWLAADPRHADYYQQCCELQQQLSALSPVWQQQLMQAEPAAWTVEVRAGLQDPPEAAVAPNQLHSAASQLVPASSKLQHVQLWCCRLAACVAMLAIGWLGWHTQTTELNLHWQTGVGQFASYQLPDGSTIKLDAATKLEVRYAADERQILLQQGQAFFEVAADNSRPFVVKTPDSQIKVLGTGFAVGWFASYSQVEVAHGKVEFSYPGEVRQLTAGQRLQGKLNSQLSQLPVTAIASWRQGYLSFEQQPLSEVMAALNRYLTKPLQLADQQSAALRLTATFQLDQLAQLPDMLPKVLPVQLEAQPTQWLIRYQAEPFQPGPLQAGPIQQ